MSSSEERLLAGIAHLGIFLNFSGLLIALIIYLLQKDKSYFTAAHAKQALGYQIAVLILSFFTRLIGLGSLFGSMMLFGEGLFSFASVSLIGLFLGIISFALAVYAIFGSYKAFTGEDFKYAVIGDFVKRI